MYKSSASWPCRISIKDVYVFADLALSAPSQDNFALLVTRKKYLYNSFIEYYNSKVGVKPWVAFDMGITRSVENFISSLQPQ